MELLANMGRGRSVGAGASGLERRIEVRSEVKRKEGKKLIGK